MLVPCISCGGLAYFTSPEMDDYFTRVKEFNRRWFPRMDEEQYETATEAERDQMDAEYESTRQDWVFMRKVREALDPPPDRDRDDPDQWACATCDGYGRQTLAAAERALAERKSGFRW